MAKDKLTKVPFKEILVSRYETFRSVLNIITQQFNKPSDSKGRLIIRGKDIVSGAKLDEPLYLKHIRPGMLFYAEYLTIEGTWPSEKLKGKQAKDPDVKKGQPSWTKGIYNMGNACYMNAPCQSLANIHQFHEYYIDKKAYEDQINVTSENGYKGELVISFAELIRDLWKKESVTVPRDFRRLVGQLDDDFGGDDMQDADDFLDFLVDGLHEDTNLRT